MNRSSTLFYLFLLPVAAQPVVSPDVHPDRTVTFSLKAPNAQSVRVSLEGRKDPFAMTKGDNGIWTVTTEALEPDIYGYSFNVDGVNIMDPSNPGVKPSAIAPQSSVYVPGTPPQIWEVAAVPRGTVRHHFYDSKIIAQPSDFWVYTPPGFTPKKKYPLLVLLHGFSDDASAWSAYGKMNVILDNLIAAGKARPMIVVMPFGYGVPAILKPATGPAATEQRQQNTPKFKEVVLTEVIPLVEQNYPIEKKREMRAIVGLSMGGAESLYTGLTSLDKFAYVGAFSAGMVPQPYDKSIPNLSAKDNARLKLLWIACGRDDRLITSNKAFTEWLTKKDVHYTWVESPGAHTWMVWRRYLAEFVPLLFR
jgi:enterochelin esterase family protein